MLESDEPLDKPRGVNTEGAAGQWTELEGHAVQVPPEPDHESNDDVF